MSFHVNQLGFLLNDLFILKLKKMENILEIDVSLNALLTYPAVCFEYLNEKIIVT